MLELRKNGLRLDVELLEERVVPSHLAHEVLLPPAAAHGAQGIQVAQQTAPDVHTRAIFTFTFTD
jgi:hypothetical protein